MGTKSKSAHLAEEPPGTALIPLERIQSLIYTVRGLQVMLDSDLAKLYGVETRILNQAVARNRERFPQDFMFRLSKQEFEELLRCQSGSSNLRSQNATSSLTSQSVISSPGHGGRRKLPYVFNEQGVAMLSSVLRSERAVHVNIAIMRAFVSLRRWALSHEELARRVSALESKYDESFKSVFAALKKLMLPPKEKRRKIGFRKGSRER